MFQFNLTLLPSNSVLHLHKETIDMGNRSTEHHHSSHPPPPSHRKLTSLWEGRISIHLWRCWIFKL